jgi:hypothetical protein
MKVRLEPREAGALPDPGPAARVRPGRAQTRSTPAQGALPF